MADETAVTGLPYMTIEVYRVNRETGEKTVIKPARVVESKEALLTSEWPPCLCPKHRERNR